MLALCNLMLVMQIAAAPTPDPVMEGVVAAVQAAVASPDSKNRGWRPMVDIENVRGISRSPANARVRLPRALGAYDESAFDRCVRDVSRDNPSSCYRSNETYVSVARVDRRPDGSLLVLGYLKSLRATPIPAGGVLPRGMSRHVQLQVFRVEVAPEEGGWRVVSTVINTTH